MICFGDLEHWTPSVERMKIVIRLVLVGLTQFNVMISIVKNIAGKLARLWKGPGEEECFLSCTTISVF